MQSNEKKEITPKIHKRTFIIIAETQRLSDTELSFAPFIRLRGKWLEKAGFYIGQQIQVHILENCLLIIPQNNNMDVYKNKIAHLVSLITQIKQISTPKINDTFDIEKVEEFLDIPEISDADWESECSKNQTAFLFFLNTYISVYERLLELLKERG